MINILLIIWGIFFLLLGLTICLCKYWFSVSQSKNKYLWGIVCMLIGFGVFIVYEINYLWG